MEFHTYKSEICHYVKSVGDFKAIEELSTDNRIFDMFMSKDYPKAFYLLGMLDFLCKKNNLNYVDRFSELRKYKLENIIYPSGYYMLYLLHNDENYLKESIKNAEYEFLKFNIVEGDIYNVA